MTKLALLLFPIAIALGPVSAGAADACADLFSSRKASPARDLTVAKEIPEGKRYIIVQAFDRVRSLSQGLKPLPSPIEVVLSDRSGLAAGGAILDEGRIEIKESALELSDKAFETFIIHEFTHFVVVRNFRSKMGGDQSLYEFLTAVRNDKSGRYDWTTAAIVAQEHTAYAELLCDVAAVMLNRNPRALPEMIDEFYKITAKWPDERASMDSLLSDQPRELSLRDFTVPYQEPGWKSYRPKDINYNRFNQIRSYLWQRWIERVPAGQEPRAFAKLVNTFEAVYFQGQLDLMTSMNGTAASNEALINHLETQSIP